MPESGAATPSTADIIALVAVAVSIVSWIHAAFIEYRIKKRDDRRAAFDVAVMSPFCAKLDLLEPILLQINVICSERDDADRATQLSELQRREHSSWYMVMASFIEAQDANTFAVAHVETNDYWDRMADYINDLSTETDAKRLISLRREANNRGQKYLTRQRSEIYRRRSLI